MAKDFCFITIRNKGEKYNKIFIENYARIMNFIDNKQKIIHIHFIYNGIYLSEVLKLKNFESYYYKSGKQNSSDLSENFSDLNISDIFIGDFISIFINYSIKNIYKYNAKPI